jgi:hypothetical protein
MGGTEVCIGRHFDVLHDVYDEEIRQDKKWGAERSHPDGTGPEILLLGAEMEDLANLMRTATDNAARDGRVSWAHILLEEVFEALAEEDPAKLRTELIQSAAVIGQWAEDIDRRNSGGDK